MKPVLRTLNSLVILVGLTLTSSAMAGRAHDREVEQLKLYRTYAGEAVESITYAGHFLDWTSLGDNALALWTRRNTAWLIEFNSSCDGLDYAHRIGVRGGLTGRLSSRFDSIIVVDTGMTPMPRIPCRIKSIQPLDVKALRVAEKAAREARQRGTSAPPSDASGV